MEPVRLLTASYCDSATAASRCRVGCGYRTQQSSTVFALNLHISMSTTTLPISTLAGRVVTHWQGTEMALAEGKVASDIRWDDPSIPYLQLTNLDLQLTNGQAFRLLSQLDDGTGFHGIYL